MSSTKLYCYKMKSDRRFAPNPFFDTLTLATCKPKIRRSSNVDEGTWIAGWTSKALKYCSTEVGDERLVYLARVKKKLTFAQYWEEYRDKRPILSMGKHDDHYWGDNIYKPIYDPISNEIVDYEQIPNCDHTSEQKDGDLSGEKVIIFGEFYYFSSKENKPLFIDSKIKPDIINKGCKITRDIAKADAFISHVRQLVKDHPEICTKYYVPQENNN